MGLPGHKCGEKKGKHLVSLTAGTAGRATRGAVGQGWGHVALSIVGTCSALLCSSSCARQHISILLVTSFPAGGGQSCSFGSVPEPPSKGELLWERSLAPPAPLAALLLFRPMGSARGTCSMPTKSLFSLRSLKCQHSQCRASELPPDPISSRPRSTSPPRYTCRTEAVIFP